MRGDRGFRRKFDEQANKLGYFVTKDPTPPLHKCQYVTVVPYPACP